MQIRDTNLALDREKAERDLIEELVEQFLQNEEVMGYVQDTLDRFQLDFDHRQAMTNDQMELICQYQNVIHAQLVGLMLRRLLGR